RDATIRAGEVREWLNRAVSKTVVPLRVPWVRIPPSPPLIFQSLSGFAALRGAIWGNDAVESERGLVALTLYRRHSRRPGKCFAGHPPDSRTYEPEERRRRAKKCACPIYADGTLAGRFKRKNTGEIEWEHARRVAAEWEAAGAWEQGAQVPSAPALVPEPPTSVSPVAPVKPAITVQFATEAYLANRAARQIQEST